ncbi:MAG: HAMP domain-containing histidine kinase [Planctomycetes bacterium]|nr:HAMP domain-containing histidine kinase [Planctomycetota bacterium]
MSLRTKLIAAIVISNLVVLAVLAWLLRTEGVSFVARVERSFEASFEAEMPAVLRRFVEQSAASGLTIERVLESGNFGILCEDVMVVDFRKFSDDGGYLQFNPLGAWNRDPERFPRERIFEALDQAIRERRAKRVAGGLCMPIEGQDGDVVGGGWFLPHPIPEPRMPVRSLLMTFGIAIATLGAFLYFGLDKWVLQPLGLLGDTAREFEEGHLEGSPRIPANAAPELVRVINAFDRAGKQISRHREELATAVEVATARARQRERELVLSQRLAAIGTLAAGISHEINNPLAAMMNAVRRLRRSPRAEDEKWLELVDEGLLRIGKIVRRTLDFAPRSATPIPFRPAEAIDRARDLVAHRLQRDGIDFGFDDATAPDDLVLGDSHEMSQVFLNLFLNSADAIEDGGRKDGSIHVTVRTMTDEDGLRVLRVLVEDNGPGASAETIERLFDPFYSTKGATANTEKLSSGLGMSISYAIVEQHGGTMRVRSRPGEGFVAEIDLPQASSLPESGMTS